VSIRLRQRRSEKIKRQKLTPALPIEVVTPNVFIDSSPMVATTKGVKMGPGHCGGITRDDRVSQVFSSSDRSGDPVQGDRETHDTVDSDTLVLDELVRQGPGESDNSALGRGVIDQLGVTDEGYIRDRIERA
jgi:hypothetical protein